MITIGKPITYVERRLLLTVWFSEQRKYEFSTRFIAAALPSLYGKFPVTGSVAYEHAIRRCQRDLVALEKDNTVTQVGKSWWYVG